MPAFRSGLWPMVVRTCVFDELILRAIKSDGVDTVVNLAAGLDARPWRMTLPSSTRWIDVDLPEILAYKRDVLAGEPALRVSRPRPGPARRRRRVAPSSNASGETRGARSSSPRAC